MLNSSSSIDTQGGGMRRMHKLHFPLFQVRRRDANGGQIHLHAWQMQRPGAVSHARFMAKGIYFMKIYMTRHQLPRHVLLPRERQQVERVAKFTFFLYAKYFLQAMLPAAAPRLDLELWGDVQHFQVQNIHNNR